MDSKGTAANQVRDETDAIALRGQSRDDVTEEGEEAEWIKKHIKRRDCTLFIQKSENPGQSQSINVKRCKCGYTYQEHPHRTAEGLPDEKWDHKVHAKATEPTDAFGEIAFVGFGDQTAKYVRVASETDEKTLYTLMMDKWKMAKPKLLISVTGGASDFSLKPRLKEACLRGLRSMAKIPGAWLVTGGTHAGVMKLVGKAVADLGLAQEGSALTAIGIAPWGCLKQRAELTNPNGKWPVPYEVGEEDNPSESYLDPNHTHFILVDNGTNHEWATEIELRTALEKHIVQMSATDTEDDPVKKVPVALLVLEGGPGTLKTVAHSIRAKTPTIVIKGSGRCADVLAYAAQHAKPVEIEENGTRTTRQLENQIDPRFEDEISRLVREAFRLGTDTNLSTYVSQVKESVRYPHLLSVYDLNARGKSTSDVDVAILKALLKAMKGSVTVQLELALSWNRVDVAKSEIFTDEKTWKTEELADVMMAAIKQDKTSFVKMFLENGFSLRDFLTMERLRKLYSEYDPKNSLLNTLLQKYEQSQEYPLRHVGRVLQDLMGHVYVPNHLKMKELPKDSAVCAQELFLWSVLVNQHEMSKLFWRQGNESTADALVANSLLKTMALRSNDIDVLQTLQRNAEEYGELAIGVLNTCYYKDERKAQNVLVRVLPRWGKVSCVLIALKSDNRRFISQMACQSLLTSVWMGRLSKDNSLCKIFLCMAVFPLIFGIIRFRDERSSSENKSAIKSIKISPSKDSVASTSQQQTKTDRTRCRWPETLTTGWKKSVHFYRAPVVVFILNCISYLVFLGLYSYMLLVQLTPAFHCATEIFIVLYLVSIFLEGLRQFVSFIVKRSKWKLSMDGSTILAFVVGVALRSVPARTCNSCYEWGRVFLALNLIPLFFRVLYYFSINQKLGPMVVMIRRMVTDLFLFVLILLVFIMSYAIAAEAMMYPNKAPSWHLLYDVFGKSYWSIYGEPKILIEIEGDECKANQTALCPTEISTYLVPVFTGIYLLLTNVLLLNLLIAMFSYTFQKVHENNDQHWHYQKFKLIVEHAICPCLPPPFTLLGHLYMGVRWFCAKYGWCSKRSRTAYFKKRFDAAESKQLVKWEDIMTKRYLTTMDSKRAESVEGRVKVVMKRLEAVQNKVDDLTESQGYSRDPAFLNPATSVASAPPSSEMMQQVVSHLQQLEERFTNIESKVDDLVDCQGHAREFTPDLFSEATGAGLSADLLRQVIKQQQRLEERLVGMEDRIQTRIMKTK